MAPPSRPTAVRSPLAALADLDEHSPHGLRSQVGIVPEHSVARIGRNNEGRAWSIQSPFAELSDSPSEHHLLVAFIDVGRRVSGDIWCEGSEDDNGWHI